MTRPYVKLHIGPGYYYLKMLCQKQICYSLRASWRTFKVLQELLRVSIDQFMSTPGRLSSSALIAISGQEELPIISSSSELACLIVLSAHKQGGHKMASDTIARTRLIAYIHRPGKLVKSVLDSCTLCKLKREVKSQQLIGKLSWDRVCPISPFQKVSLDLVGHFLVKPTLSSRTMIKVWILIYLCDISKALHTEVVDSMASSAI